MEKKLTDSQTRMILALINERQRLMQEMDTTIGEFAAMVAGDEFAEPVVEHRGGEFYVVEKEEYQRRVAGQTVNGKQVEDSD